MKDKKEFIAFLVVHFLIAGFLLPFSVLNVDPNSTTIYILTVVASLSSIIVLTGAARKDIEIGKYVLIGILANAIFLYLRGGVRVTLFEPHLASYFSFIPYGIMTLYVASAFVEGSVDDRETSPSQDREDGSSYTSAWVFFWINLVTAFLIVVGGYTLEGHGLFALVPISGLFFLALPIIAFIIFLAELFRGDVAYSLPYVSCTLFFLLLTRFLQWLGSDGSILDIVLSSPISVGVLSIATLISWLMKK